MGMVLKPRTPFAKTITVIIVASLVCGSMFVYLKAYGPAPKETTDNSIRVFLPDWQTNSDDAFYQDGRVQKRGFDQAIEDTSRLAHKLNVQFEPMSKEETPAQLLKRMKELYENGTTFFVMTMSAKVQALQESFGDWHKECKDKKLPTPILVTTVASAPSLADRSVGILRWYIRSDEESSLLAEYMRWKLAVTRVGVFYITRNSQQSDDPYGNRGMVLFRDRFIRLGGIGTDVIPLSVTAEIAQSRVQDFLDRYYRNKLQNTTGVGVFVVGYGDMVKHTMTELITQGFKGPIVCTSTLTEPQWQPRDTSADGRIFTVLPSLKDHEAKLQGDDRNVVFLFAKKTLHRLLELTQIGTDPKSFLDRWGTTPDVEPPFDQEQLADGDIAVQLEVIGSRDWR